jgi:hypothetical protein
MNRRFSVLAAVMLFGLGLLQAQTETKAESAAPIAKVDLPSAESLLSNYVDVTGGAKAYEEVKTVSATGTFSMASAGISGQMKAYSAWPNKSYAIIEIPGVGNIEEGTTGDMAWENSALQGARIKSGDEAAAVIRESALDLHINWKNYYQSARTIGVEDVDGKPAYKVLMTPKDGAPESVYFDKTSGLIVKQTAVYDTPMGKIPTEVNIGDYRQQGNLKMPFLVRQHVAGQDFEMKMDKVTLNAEIPASRFDPPAEVKALQTK